MEECKDGKIFIGGLSRMTSEETLKEYFNKYGEVKECQVLRDRVTRISRGFGFLTFVDPSHVHQLLQIPHTINGRMVDVKTARPRVESSQNRNEHENTTNGNCHDEIAVKKIFVGGLPSTLKTEDFKKYFEQFGKVEDGVVMYNSENQSRGFGFITFDSEEAVENVLQKQRVKFHELENKRVEVKRATPKDITNRKMYTYDTKNIGLGFGIQSTFSGYGGYHPYAYMPHYYYYYYYYYYGVETYSGGGYGFYQSSFPYDARVFHSAFTGARMNGCDNGLLDINNDNNYKAPRAISSRISNGRKCGDAEVPVPSSIEAISLESVAKPIESTDEEMMTASFDRSKSSSSVGDDQSDSPTTSACLSCHTETLSFQSNGSNNENGSLRKSCLCSFN